MGLSQNRGKAVADSYIELRLLAAMTVGAMLLTLLVPTVLRAVDANGDNLDDAWESRYGITTNAYASTNLAGWWQMDGPTNVTDRSGNQIDGTLGSLAADAFGPGLFSNALSFTPQGHVDFPTNAALNLPNGLTFSAWFKADAGIVKPVVIATWTDLATNSWSVGADSNGVAGITFSDAAGTVQTVGPSINPVRLYDGAWHHLAASWSPEKMARVYVDGDNQASGAIAGWTPGTIASFSLGTPDDSTTNRPFTLDETRLYNRALGPAEISQLPVTYTDFNGNGLSVWEDYQRGLNPTEAYTGMALHSTNAAPEWHGEPNSSEFTPWMTDPELHKFMLQFDTTPPGGHPNYWDKGHWINAVEGRWHDGVVQFRITYSPVPKHKGLWWYWYLGIDEKSFNRHAREMAADGFSLLDANSFAKPNGTRLYQGVWHKVTQATPAKK